MYNTSKTHRNKGKKITALATLILVVAILLQSLSMCCFAALDALGVTDGPMLFGPSNGITYFNSKEAVAQLKQSLLKSINQDLLKKIDEYELTGEVGVILTFSENDLITQYTRSYADQMTYREFQDSQVADELRSVLEQNQRMVLKKLQDKGLIKEVKYNYFHMLDGAFVKTTYEQIEEISEIVGVQRITVSNTYKAAVAVENPVDVYETGIFNSSDISYTGKGTVVAVLDTGCDYTHSAFTSHAVVDPLYDRAYIDSKLADTMAYSLSGGLESREVYYGNITNNKIVFGYDYADKDPEIMPFNNNHGTHVAGIIAGKDDVITGVAVDAQLAIMKVFSDYKDGGEDGDILAALEDSIVLQVDAINMSLGSASGFTREVDDQYKNDLYDRIEAAGISLLAAASNDYSSAFGSEQSNTNKTSNPDSGILGSPSTYNAAMSVASINGNKDKYMMANGDHEVFFHESSDLGAKEYDFYAMLGVQAGQTATFEYVTVPGVGMPINYAGLDVTGKIALVRRGDISFEEKVQYAYEAGAIAVIIYNNITGDIIMTIGNEAKIPAISIDRDDGDRLAERESGTLVFDLKNQAGPFMSDFSSWGPSADLSLKPEITAHGGNILSAIPGGDYDELSGTSMATPNMCGITVLIRQYVKDKYPEMKPTEVRDLVNQLCMSTATIALDQKGHPYSPRKQGAGIADIGKATTTKAYLLVDGIGKTKLELGDDPTRSGVYTMSINLKNISDTALSYRLGNIVMTETVSSSDPEYVAEMGYLLSNATEYAVKGGTLTDGVVTVAAGETATVTVTITLSAADKAYLNASFKNGMYVEGFLTFDDLDENGVDLNAPFLAFYGDWAEAPIFDLDYYKVETEAHNNAIDDDDKIKADYYATTPVGTYYYDYMIPLGTYLYDMDESQYTAIPATEEKAAISYYADCISGLYGVLAGLLRATKELKISIINTTTGEEVWSDTQYNCYKAHYGGAPVPYFSEFKLPMADYETGEVLGYNNERFEVTMTASLDWQDGIRNSSDTYSFSFYIDYQAPTVSNATFRTEYDKARKENRYYVDMMVYDNHYAMSTRPIVVYDYVNEEGEDEKTFSSLAENPIPIYQQSIGATTKVTMEITDYMDQIRASSMPEGLTVYLDDYALNSSICYIPFPELDNDDLDFVTDSKDLDINETFDLTTYMTYEGLEGSIESEYLKNLTWSSSDESVVAVHQGQIEAKKAGKATITVTGQQWDQPREIKINVSETEVSNPLSSAKVQIKSLTFTSYYTEFAFTSDIDYSEIGKSESTNYFGGNYNLAVYPSERFRLNYTLEPWNLDPERYTLKWTSSNPSVATVDQNGLVTAVKEGNARISLQITIDGKTSLLAARCSVEVKSEFVIENRTLVAYKGVGGEVVIPDDEGIVYIGAFAFSHFDLDNKKEVEKDEDGNYDFDDKKTALGNDTVTSVVIPEGVDTIYKYAFYNCSALRDVVLPESCKVIEEYAFYDCKKLVNINMDHVQTVDDYVFTGCASMTGEDLGGINLSHVSAIGAYSFSGTRLADVDLSNLGRSGVGAFKDCEKLKTVTLGEKTRLANEMFENTALVRAEIYADTIPDAAFKNCTKLTTVIAHNDLTYLGEQAFSGCTKLSSVTFGGICEEIAFSAFSLCSALTSLTLPDCSVRVGDSAFAGSGLKSLSFGANTRLQIMGGGVFNTVTGLTLDLADTNAYVVENGVLYNADKTELVLALPDAALGAFVVPASVRKIGNGAFSACRHLTSVTFAPGSALESIGVGAFSFCGALTGVTLPESNNVSIDAFAFYDAAQLKAINLDKVTSVGEAAFQNTVLTDVVLASSNVTVGDYAFYVATTLKSLTLGDKAAVGAYAFAGAGLTAVTFKGDGVTVGEGSFFACTALTDFDFSKLTGKLGDGAFAQCVRLTTVVMPHVTEIGMGCFADCPNITTLDAAKLEIVGTNAFAPTSEDAVIGGSFTTVNLPSLRVIGDYAFFGCLNLESIDLSNVETIGQYAFAACQSLKTAPFSEKLTVIPEGAFYGCAELTDLNLEHVVQLGTGCLLGVKLPAHLTLPSVEILDSMAFLEQETNYLESLDAPKLTHVGDQAFVGCAKLTEVNAPNMEYIGFGAFAYTAIEEMEISGALKEVEFSVFEGNSAFKAFYAMVNGEKVYDHEFDTVMLKDGVLYTVVKNGYVLSVYPTGKTDAELNVVDGTVRIEYTAAMENKHLEKVIFPESLRSIGNYSFYGCSALKTVVFNSYYAPVLEGTMTGGSFKIKPDTEDLVPDTDHIIVYGDEDTEDPVVEDFPGFDKLYHYDYYYAYAGEVGIPFYYSNFVDLVGTVGASELTCVLPENCERYDSLIYKAYFTVSEENSGVAVGKYALAFIDAAKKLPEVADRFDKKLIDAAIVAYNALERHADELALVDEALITRYHAARTEYNISVAENKIDHLFDLDCSEYSFELVKDARATFLALTETEQALVSNADKLNTKITELATVMGKQPDFTLTFAAHFPNEDTGSGETQQPTVPPTDGGEQPAEDGLKGWQIALIVIGAVLVAGGIGVGVFFLLKKRKGAAPESEELPEVSPTSEEDATETEFVTETEPAAETEPAPEADSEPDTQNEEERPKE